jgi:hypothetical protein
VFGRLLLAVLAFGGTSAAILILTSQLAPGWRPPEMQPAIEPRVSESGARRETYEVEQSTADITAKGSGNLAAWILQPAVPSAAGPVPGVVLVHGAGHDRLSP